MNYNYINRFDKCSKYLTGAITKIADDCKKEGKDLEDIVVRIPKFIVGIFKLIEEFANNPKDFVKIESGEAKEKNNDTHFNRNEKELKPISQLVKEQNNTKGKYDSCPVPEDL
jgi:hypothetical protein